MIIRKFEGRFEMNQDEEIREMLRSSGDFTDRDLDDVVSELKHQRYLKRLKKSLKPKRKNSKLDKLCAVIIPLLGVFVIWYFLIRRL